LIIVFVKYSDRLCRIRVRRIETWARRLSTATAALVEVANRENRLLFVYLEIGTAPERYLHLSPSTTPTLVLDMPPKKGAKKGAKGKSAKAKAVAASPPPPVEVATEVTADDTAMQTDEPETADSVPSISTTVPDSASNLVQSTETLVVNVVEVAKEKVEDVAKAAGEFVEEMTMTGIEESGRSSSKSGDATPAEQSDSVETKMTMEERKAKFNELRKKMVRSWRLNCVFY